MEIVMIGDKYLVSGFRLIGIDTIEADDDASAMRKVEQLVSEGTRKVIIITERVAVKLKPLREDMLRTRRLYPIFVIVPDWEGGLNERTKELYQLVNQAIGTKLKLGG
jgi:vacuolar-type H+-ATPase subunit F/Vma7